MVKNITGYPSIDKTHLVGIPKSKLEPITFSINMLTLFCALNVGHMDEICIEENGKKYTKKRVLHDALTIASDLLVFSPAHRSKAKSTSKRKNQDPKLAIIAPNCYEGIVATLGANAIGIAVVMIEPRALEDRELLLKELNLHKPVAVLAYGKSSSWAVELTRDERLHFKIRRLWIIKPTSAINGCDPFSLTFNVLKNKDVDPLAKLNSFTHAFSYKNRAMLYLKTSGSSSGEPKTLPFNNKAIMSALVHASNSTGMKPRDPRVGRVLCNAPYQHGYGWMPLFMNLISGMEVVLVGGTKQDVSCYYKLSPGHIYGTPLTLHQFIMTAPSNIDLSSLTAFYCAGETLAEEEYRKGIDFFRKHKSNAEIRNNYGISEALCIGTATDGIEHIPGTIGKFYLGSEKLIVDDNLKEVKYNVPGELLIASDTLCMGYFNDPEATRRSFIEINGKTYFRTGDILSLREDGYVKFYDRKRRFFFAEGVTDKVNCATIEQALMELDPIDQAAVAIKKYGGIDGAKAFVTLRQDDESVSVETIRQGVSKKLLDFQMPREIVIIDKIPIRDSGKIDYPALEQM